ncbi:hypothetical protein N7539_004268 [Penicillium diatomitis]|uniref:Uncharacterized protein n=1 Tax=Penicillium diatomitis TaxID=2819901 RepID=A0A9W9XE55_9EURO|nr:uncharacterized protein N7539_004268 [Penicillium diatomitis]KAJ5489378.1 hypothetical protein N7539_004268 [Penicillium diatomitis]
MYGASTEALSYTWGRECCEDTFATLRRVGSNEVEKQRNDCQHELSIFPQVFSVSFSIFIQLPRCPSATCSTAVLLVEEIVHCHQAQPTQSRASKSMPSPSSLAVHTQQPQATHGILNKSQPRLGQAIIPVSWQLDSTNGASVNHSH